MQHVHLPKQMFWSHPRGQGCMWGHFGTMGIIWPNSAEVHFVMLHTKISRLYALWFPTRRFYHVFPILAYVKHLTPRAGPFLAARGISWTNLVECGFRQEDFESFILKIYFSLCDLDMQQTGTIWTTIKTTILIRIIPAKFGKNPASSLAGDVLRSNCWRQTSNDHNSLLWAFGSSELKLLIDNSKFNSINDKMSNRINKTALENEHWIAVPLLGTEYASPNKHNNFHWFWFPLRESLTESSKYQVLFKVLEWFSSTFQGRLNFQGLFKTVFHI